MEAKRSEMSPQESPQPRWSISSGSGLQYGSLVNSVSSLSPMVAEKPAISPTRAYITIAVLCYVNLINYMERYTIPGVLTDIKNFFSINDSTVGLLQTGKRIWVYEISKSLYSGCLSPVSWVRLQLPPTLNERSVFICSFLFLAPLFGYLGDRYNRKYIMIGGLSVWLLTAACSSFVTESQFWLLIVLRALVGIGEASYSTIAPTIIGDLFSGGRRSIMISIFYVFIPVGSGLGYIVGAGIASVTTDWRWALRVTPIMGLVGLILMVFLCPNPPRGAAETNGGEVTDQSSYLEDIKYLLKNKSYVWSTLGVTALAFLTGALAFWLPTFLSRARIPQELQPNCTKEPCDSSDSYIFGAVTVATGILGGALGTILSRQFGGKVLHADPLICAVGMMGSVPCLFIIIFVASASIPATYVFIFLGELLLSLNWPVLADILLYVVVPTRRATAEALQITIGHLLGDAGSPYLIGVISDAINATKPQTDEQSFTSLKYSLLVCPFMGILGGVFFLITTLYITEDRKAVQQLIEEDPRPQQGPTPESSMEQSSKSTA